VPAQEHDAVELPMGAVAGDEDVVLRIGGSPENVRTARLVAAAVARREGLPEDRVDEVRIAVGEAVTWALNTITDRAVEVVLGPGGTAGEQFVVRVGGGLSLLSSEATGLPESGGDDLALALLRGLADDVHVDGDVTVLTWRDL
jgi:hypothetical protein